MRGTKIVTVGLMGVLGLALLAAGAASRGYAGEAEQRARAPNPKAAQTARGHDSPPAAGAAESTTPPPVMFVVTPDQSPATDGEGAPHKADRGAAKGSEPRPAKTRLGGGPGEAARLPRALRSASSADRSDAPVSTPALLSVPSLDEQRGRVGAMPLSDTRARIEEAGSGPGALVEQPIQPTALEGDRPRHRERIGLISQAALDQQLRQQLPTLNACRVEIARQKALTWSGVAAGRVTLQWTILPTGGVSDANVIAVDPLDPYVQDCVLRRMRQWTFVRPSSGMTVPVTRSFEFR